MFKPKGNWCRYHKSNRDEYSLEKEPYHLKIQKFDQTTKLLIVRLKQQPHGIQIVNLGEQ